MFVCVVLARASDDDRVDCGRALDVDSLLLLLLLLLLLPGATATAVLRTTGRYVVYATSTHMTRVIF